jgi:hypothetical protein
MNDERSKLVFQFIVHRLVDEEFSFHLVTPDAGGLQKGAGSRSFYATPYIKSTLGFVRPSR